MLRTSTTFISCLFLSVLFSCATAKGKPQLEMYPDGLKNGDLIFVEAQVENLSGAINRVTQQTLAANFDHIGLVEVSEDAVFVLHASTKLGSAREELFDFYSKNKANQQQMVIYRLRDAYQHTTAQALQEAKAMLGKAYNFSYILNDETYYCSDFIERAFRKGAVFEHIPMNFKNPNTGKIDDFWLGFYEKQQLEVPQDQPGTNPNQLAASEKLLRLGQLKWSAAE